MCNYSELSLCRYSGLSLGQYSGLSLVTIVDYLWVYIVDYLSKSTVDCLWVEIEEAFYSRLSLGGNAMACWLEDQSKHEKWEVKPPTSMLHQLGAKSKKLYNSRKNGVSKESCNTDDKDPVPDKRLSILIFWGECTRAHYYLFILLA